MIKELFLAIALGALLGFGITGGYFSLKNQNSSRNQPTPTPTATNQETETSGSDISTISDTGPSSTSSNITIDTPADNAVVDTSKLKISGTTAPDSFLIILTPLGDFNTTADKSGKFELQVNIESGVNLIKINAIDPDDNQSDTQLMVTYSTAQF